MFASALGGRASWPVDRLLLWLVLLLPLTIQTWRYADTAIYYGEYLHWTGVQATRLLIVTLAVSPLLRLLPRMRPLRWAMQRRRDLGLITFAFATAHTIAYIARKADLQLIVSEGLEFDLLTGWLAAVIFVALALTSNNVSVRRLGRRWRTLHKSVYAAAALTLAHWVLTAFDPAMAYWHAAVVAILLVLRAWRTGR